MKTKQILQEVTDYYGSLIHICETATEYLIANGYIVTSWDNRGHSTRLEDGPWISHGTLRLPTHLYVRFVTPKQTKEHFTCYGFSLCIPNVVTPPMSVKTGSPLEYVPFGYICKANLPHQQDYYYDLANDDIQRYLWPFMSDPPLEMPCMTFTPEDRDKIDIPQIHGINSLSLIPFRLDSLSDDDSVVNLFENAFERFSCT